jgi:hypothetical protein
MVGEGVKCDTVSGAIPDQIVGEGVRCDTVSGAIPEQIVTGLAALTLVKKLPIAITVLVDLSRM